MRSGDASGAVKAQIIDVSRKRVLKLGKTLAQVCVHSVAQRRGTENVAARTWRWRRCWELLGRYSMHDKCQTRKESMKRLATLALVLALTGCAAHVVHPGSANKFDSDAYDSVLVTHSVIETTKTDLANNAFPASIAGNVKTALNDLITGYNAADAAYQAYHNAALAGTA